MYVMYDSLHSNGIKKEILEMRVAYEAGDIKTFL